jgi:hypothetical protein
LCEDVLNIAEEKYIFDSGLDSKEKKKRNLEMDTSGFLWPLG